MSTHNKTKSKSKTERETRTVEMKKEAENNSQPVSIGNTQAVLAHKTKMK